MHLLLLGALLTSLAAAEGEAPALQTPPTTIRIPGLPVYNENTGDWEEPPQDWSYLRDDRDGWRDWTPDSPIAPSDARGRELAEACSESAVGMDQYEQRQRREDCSRIRRDMTEQALRDFAGRLRLGNGNTFTGWGSDSGEDDDPSFFDRVSNFLDEQCARIGGRPSFRQRRGGIELGCRARW